MEEDGSTPRRERRLSETMPCVKPRQLSGFKRSLEETPEKSSQGSSCCSAPDTGSTSAGLVLEERNEAEICTQEEPSLSQISDTAEAVVLAPSKNWFWSRQGVANVEIEDEFAVGREKLMRPTDCSDDSWNAVSRQHCLLRTTSDGRLFVRSHTKDKLHFSLEGETEWRQLSADGANSLERTFERQPFRIALLDPRGNGRHLVYDLTPVGPGPDALSFDEQHRQLIRRILSDEAAEVTNKKGSNRMLKRPCDIVLDLHASSGKDGAKMALPLTSLRNVNAKHSVTEALWYLRGEEHIKFLKRHGNPFWDTAVKNGRCPEEHWLGLNYGLLVNWPSSSDSSAPPTNQLEEKVIGKLVKGECSRQMSCTLTKPDEPTEQEACTTSCQFLVRADNPKLLDLCLHQRSSDVVMGLTSDVVVWSILLHLVCREVRMRTNGAVELSAGRVEFKLTSAHIYTRHIEGANLLASREPITESMPVLRIATAVEDRGMFDIARDFEHGPQLLSVEGQRAHAGIKFEL